MKKIILLGIISLTLLSSKHYGKSYKIEETRNILNPLALYGENIFERENCISCHSFSIENTNKISLDGFGKKMTTEWLFRFFQDPKSIIVNCKMPAFKILFKQDLSKELLKKYLEVKNIYDENVFDNTWDEFIQKSDSIYSDLDYSKEIKFKRKEIFALIDFLQNIPSTDKKKELDNILLEKEKIKNKRWDEFAINSDSLVTLYLTDKVYISKGQKHYEEHCLMCHNQNGTGMIGPNLIDENSIFGTKMKNITNVILNGTDNGMPNFNSRLEEKQMLELLVYIDRLKK